MNKQEKIIKLIKKDINGFNRWRKIFKIDSVDLMKANLNHTVLKGGNFSNCNLSRATMLCTNAKDADFSNCTLHRADFSVSNFENCTFTGSIGFNVKFKSCYAYNIKLNNVLFEDVTFDGTNLHFANLKYSCFRNTSFTNCNLDKITVRDTYVSYTVDGQVIGTYNDESMEEMITKEYREDRLTQLRINNNEELTRFWSLYKKTYNSNINFDIFYLLSTKYRRINNECIKLLNKHDFSDDIRNFFEEAL